MFAPNVTEHSITAAEEESVSASTGSNYDATTHSKDTGYSVRLFHENPESTEPLRNNFGNFLKDSCFTDLTLHLCDGKLVLHRLVLGSASPFLRKLFETECVNCEHNVDIILPSFTVSDIQPILPFLYGYAETNQKIEGQLLDCLQLGNFFLKTSSSVNRENDNINIKIKQEKQDDDYCNNYGNDGGLSCRSNGGNLDKVMPLSEDKCIDCGGNLPPRHYCTATVEPYVGETGFEWDQAEDDDYNDDDPDYTVEEKKPKKRKIKKEPSGGTIKPPQKEKGRKRRYIKLEDGCGWKCMICDAEFDTKNKIKHHDEVCVDTSSDSNDNSLKCGACKEMFKGIEELKEHIKSSVDCNSASKPPTLICEQCPTPHVFYNSQKFNSHILRHQTGIKCEHCEMVLLDHRKYARHLRAIHKKTESKLLFLCSSCPKSFIQKETLDKHVNRAHSVNKVFACDKCGKKMNSMSALKYHIGTHENAHHKCPHCSKVLTSQQGLQNHVNMHNGKTNHLCNECGMSFVTHQRLIDHQRWKHTFERTYFSYLFGNNSL